MRPDDGELPDGNLAELDDPDLALLAGAILDGTPVDWTAAAATIGSRHAATLHRLRVLADVAALHRSLTPPGAVDSAAQTSPAPHWGPLTLARADRCGSVRRSIPSLGQSTGSRSRAQASAPGVRPDAPLAPQPPSKKAVSSRVFGTRTSSRYTAPSGSTDASACGPNSFAAARLPNSSPSTAVERTGSDGHRALICVARSQPFTRPVSSIATSSPRTSCARKAGASSSWISAPAENASKGPSAATEIWLALRSIWRLSCGEVRRPTQRSDIYSLGVLLYFLVTQTHPVRGRAMQDVRDAHAAGRHVLLRDERPDLPDTFIDVVERSLARDPAERYESAGAFEAGLKHAQSSIAPQSGRCDGIHVYTNAAASAQRTVLLLAAAGIIVAAGAVLLDVGHIRSRWSGGGSGASASDLTGRHRGVHEPAQGAAAIRVDQRAWTPIARRSVLPLQNDAR